MTPPPADTRRALLIRGITWSAGFQLLEVAANFASMLVLVRIIAATDYGRAAAVAGILGLLNLFDSHLFFEHALQLPDDREPDWNLHWTYGFYLQTSLSLVCHSVAALFWFLPSYRPIAPLLHIAAFGVLLDWPNHFGAVMLRRTLDLRRVRIIASVSLILRLTTTIGLALAGKGAYAIILGNNFVTALPFGVELLVVRGWRPQPAWWRLPDWRRYAAELKFGAQRAVSNLIGGLRGGLEAAILPVPLGFAALGLLNRAQALYGTTLGRTGVVMADAAYPFLPRFAHQRERFATYATAYLQVLLLVAIPGALFVGQQGQRLSRVLYGGKWIAMDPLIWPGAVIGLSVAAFSAASGVLMASGRLRACLILDAIAALAGALALVAAYTMRQALPYSWALAAGQLVAAAACVWTASSLLESGWLQRTVLPPVTAAAAGLVAARAAAFPIGVWPLLDLVARTGAYFLAAALILRVCFSTALDPLLAIVPAGERIRQILRMSAMSNEPVGAPMVMPVLGKDTDL